LFCTLTVALLAPAGVAEAGPGVALRRVAADFVDISLGFGVGFGVVYGLNQLTPEGWMTETPGHFLLLNEVGVTAPSVLYLSISDATGGSLGKRLFGLRVEKDGAPPPFATSLARSWASVVGMEAAHVGHAYTFTDQPSPAIAGTAYGVGGGLFLMKWGVPFATGGATGYEDWLTGTEVVDTRVPVQ